jgi:hypothetical protein
MGSGRGGEATREAVNGQWRCGLKTHGLKALVTRELKREGTV